MIVAGHFRLSTGVPGNAFLVRFGPDGTVLWQKGYGQLDNVQFKRPMPTATGFLVFGSMSDGTLVLVDVDADGELVAATSYEDDAGTSTYGALDAVITADGGVAMAGGASHSNDTDGFVAIVTAPDLTIPDCGDAGVAVSVDLLDIPVSDMASLTVSDAVFVPAAATFSTRPASLTTTVTSAVPLDMCSN